VGAFNLNECFNRWYSINAVLKPRLQHGSSVTGVTHEILFSENAFFWQEA
jgi:hypothetical protein